MASIQAKQAKADRQEPHQQTTKHKKPTLVHTQQVRLPTSKPKLDSIFRKILTANIYDLVKQTSVDVMPNLSKRMDNHILLKREDKHPVFSFKIRGAYNMMRQLNEQQRARGVITVSAGNHAQGLALAAQKLGVKATIVMPITTPDTKVRKVQSFQPNLVMKGDSWDESLKYCQQLEAEHNFTYIPPFDHPSIIAGQGTVAMELLRQVSADVDAVFIPVGGGGLLAGMLGYIKYLKPHIKVYAVEPEDADSFAQAMEKGRRIKLQSVGLFADGVAVSQTGKHPFAIARSYVDGWIRVSIDEICAAVKDIFDDHRVVAEPSGALSLAGLKHYVQTMECTGKTLVAINSGANTNFERLEHIVERAQLGEKREAILAVTLPEKPGSFLKFCRILKGYSISEFNYRYAHSKKAVVFVGVRIRDNESQSSISLSLRAKGYEVVDMSDNDMAITHVRHMVGGRPISDSSEPLNEQIFRCEFQEHPNALLNFLVNLRNAGNWNISLFHYRNHGAASGRALLGLQVPAEEMAQLKAFVAASPYNFISENDNPAYTFFLH